MAAEREVNIVRVVDTKPNLYRITTPVKTLSHELQLIHVIGEVNRVLSLIGTKLEQLSKGQANGS